MKSIRRGFAGEIEASYSWRSLIKDISTFTRPYAGRFWLASFFRLSTDILMLYPVYGFAKLVSYLSQNGKTSGFMPVAVIIGLWSAAIIWRNIGIYLARSIGFGVAERVGLDAQIKSVKHLFSLDIAWHEKENTGNKLKRIQKGGDGLNSIFRMWLSNIIEISVNFVGIIFILFKFDLVVSAGMVFYIVCFTIISTLMFTKASDAAISVNVKEEDLNGLSFEALNNIRTVKVLSLGNSLLTRLNAIADDIFRRIKYRIFRFQTTNTILSMFSHLVSLTLIVYITYWIIHGRYDVGFLVLFYAYFFEIWVSLSELSDVSQDIVVARAGVGRMMRILNEPVTIDSEKDKVTFPNGWKKIVVNDLSFSYGTKKVLENVSFEINRGERVGLVGLSGAGKSTLFKLLLKEHEDYDGEILIDGVSIKNINKQDYFRHVSVVLQDTEVFNFSLKDNVTLSNVGQQFDPKLFDQSLKIAHVADFSNKLANGVDTEIGEKGVRLSGGEKQRLGLARAIFRQPQILLLDEATSHLDIESEEKIQDSLHHFFQSVTALVIAHRLTTIREMDRIIVIEGGRIIETGTFDHLYKARGRFFELWEKQRL